MAFGYYRSRRRSYSPRVIYVSSSGRSRRRSTKTRSRRKSRKTRSIGTQTSAAAVNPKKMSGTGHGDKYILSQADPFDPNVDGCKIPDANAQPSFALKALDTFDLSTSAAQSCTVLAINPAFEATFVQGVFATATSWTWPAAYAYTQNSGKLTQFRADAELFRPVAHACRVTSGLAPTAATGFVHVCVAVMGTFGQATWPLPTSVAEMQNVPGYKRIPIGRLTAEGLTLINRPLDCTGQRYQDSDSALFGNSSRNEFTAGMNWGCLIVAVTGVAASSTPVTIENVLHVENIPRFTSVSMATPAAKYNPPALAGAANAQSKAQSSALDSEKPARKASAIQAAFQGLGVAGRGTGSFLTRALQSVRTQARTPSNASMRSASAGLGSIRNDVSSGML